MRAFLMSKEAPMAFVEVYSKATGEKTFIPEHWLEHKVLGEGYRKTPLSQKAPADQAATANTKPRPVGDTTKED